MKSGMPFKNLPNLAFNTTSILHKTVLAFFLLLATSFCIGQEVLDSLQQAHITDSLRQEKQKKDSIAFSKNYTVIQYHPELLSTENKPIVSDIQQMVTHHNNALVFSLLLLLLVIITYIKAAFGSDLNELLQSFLNRNTAMQLMRTQGSELSLASLLLHINFVLTISLYARFVLVNYFNITSLETTSSILFLIFLFTFFYVAKIITMKTLGNVMDLNSECNEYIFNLSTTCKTLGLSLIPVLFIFYTAQEKFFDFVFILSLLLWVSFVIIFIWRGLSTSTKLLYRSVYHFFLYVWVIEISPIFLFFKLLTKTVT